MRNIELTYQKNVRDLGGMIGYLGKKVKTGLLFRGGYLGKVSPKDIEIINSLSLTDIVDFRSSSEFVNRPDYRFKGVTYHNFPLLFEDVKLRDSKNADSNLLWFLGDSTDGEAHMKKTYVEMTLYPNGIEYFKKFFDLISTPNKKIYFHCSQGKDRAGLAAYLLEIALGVSQKEAEEDYLATNIAMEIKKSELKKQMSDDQKNSPGYQKAFDDVFTAKREYLNYVLDSIIKKYGSVDYYLINILNVNIDKLRELYLE